MAPLPGQVWTHAPRIIILAQWSCQPCREASPHLSLLTAYSSSPCPWSLSACTPASSSMQVNLSLRSAPNEPTQKIPTRDRLVSHRDGVGVSRRGPGHDAAGGRRPHVYHHVLRLRGLAAGEHLPVAVCRLPFWGTQKLSSKAAHSLLLFFIYFIFFAVLHQSDGHLPASVSRRSAGIHLFW